jgi:hypothetical protein
VNVTPEDRRRLEAIVDWLRRRARDLAKDGADYTEGRFTARYLR